MAQCACPTFAHLEPPLSASNPGAGYDSPPGFLQGLSVAVYTTASELPSQSRRGLPASVPGWRSGDAQAQTRGNVLERLPGDARRAALAVAALQYQCRSEVCRAWH